VSWKLIKLEHAPTLRFPNGSAARGYLFRLPLRKNGGVDNMLYESDPTQSTARRFWPSEPERSGFVIHYQARWNVVLDVKRPARADAFGWFVSCRFLKGARIEITERANGAIPFDVVSVGIG
jgi:hypothetical protein